MKKISKIISSLLVLSIVFGISACSKDSNSGTNAESTTSSAADFTSGAADIEFTEAPIVEIDPNAATGDIKWLGYYDISTTSGYDEIVAEFQEKYSATVISEVCTNAEYFDTLATKIMSGNSPDFVRYEWQCFPHGISKKQYTALDSYIDLDSELWKGVKDAAENFVFLGKHYYIPHEINRNFSLIYSKTQLEEKGLTDPMELYLSGEWTWNAWKSLMQQWCDIDDTYIGYKGVNAMSLILTTGTKIIDIKPDGTIVNNMNSTSVERAMNFLGELCKEGLTETGWIGPESALLDGNLCFYGVGPDWGYGAASKALKTEEIAYVPFPRDEQADKYYIGFDTFGYMIPQGATNIKGAVDWINFNRMYVTDPERMATAKEKALNPPEKINSQGKVVWQLSYSEEQYQIMQDMVDPSKYGLLFDNCFGFNKTLTDLFNNVILGSTLYDGLSWTQVKEENLGTVDGILDEYRAVFSEFED